MVGYSIDGGNKLCGEIKIQGSKNSVLPIMAASILNKGKTVLHNCPRISDVNNMVSILESLGCGVLWQNDCIEIDASTISNNTIYGELVGRMRSSIMLLGGLLGRLKEVKIGFPGGCTIGKRPIDYHIQAVESMNVTVCEKNGIISCKTKELKGAIIQLLYPSVGATENILLAGVLASGNTHIFNPAKEPEIIELIEFLKKMGARIYGGGTNHIIINGVKELGDVEFTIGSDRIVVGTYMAAAAITKGELTLRKVNPEYTKVFNMVFRKMGCDLRVYNKNVLTIKACDRLKSIGSIRTFPYPGFPTDMQAILMACLCTSDGTSFIYENVFENRFMHVKALREMGANIVVKERCAMITGSESLNAARVNATDLRGGAAIVLAALASEGVSEIYQINHMLRGYQDFVKTLNSVGAKMKCIDDKRRKYV